MIGSNRPRMLDLALPHVTWWNSWYSGFANDPTRVGPLLETIDEAARRAGRDPSTLKKSVAVYLGFERSPQRRTGGTPWWGAIEDHVVKLQQLAAAGIDEVQGILDPITADTIGKYGEIVAAFRTSH
jgi:hypothetical protein